MVRLSLELTACGGYWFGPLPGARSLSGEPPRKDTVAVAWLRRVAHLLDIRNGREFLGIASVATVVALIAWVAVAPVAGLAFGGEVILLGGRILHGHQWREVSAREVLVSLAVCGGIAAIGVCVAFLLGTATRSR